MNAISPIATSEAAIQAEIRKALGRYPDIRLFRNNRGKAWMGEIAERSQGILVLKNPRPVEFGLTDGASDLIGLRRVTITPEMVGQTVAMFIAMEVKRPGVRVLEHQQRFVDFVEAFGGISGVPRSVDDALEIARVKRP